MSEESRRQQRRERIRRRRSPGPVVYAAAKKVPEMPGIFGWMQRNGRVFILAGIFVMLASLGGSFLAGAFTGAKGGNTATATVAPTVECGRPVGTPNAEGVVRRYSCVPAMQIDHKKQYEAVIRTEKGDVWIALLPDAAPQTVNNFVFLARNRFFEGLTFHRVIAGFVAQGGDSLGNGNGDAGYKLPTERNAVHFDAGIVAMAKSSAGVSSSQFFITLAP
ncbi:MAG: peptidylprolyl isomerase, partial [Dehalococcoidia bacterium]|nr:peptidylprolyl isomerase [Dehalococcoidia bacterium]